MLAKTFATVLTVLLLVLSATLACRAEGAEVWPCFRGPSGMGVVQDDPRLPELWSKTENVRWVTEVPGRGWSCPIVAAGKVFVTAVVNEKEYEKPQRGLYNGTGRAEPPEGLHRWMVYCLDLDSGKILWQQEAHQGQPQVPRHPKSTYASETPVTDGQRVYVLFGDVGLYCYDLDGKQVWSRLIEPKKSLFNYGAASSPLICDGLVIVVYDNMEDRYIAAFDAQTGEQRWRTARPARAHPGDAQHVGHAAGLEERPAHGDRHLRLRLYSLLRSARQRALGTEGPDLQPDHSVTCFRPRDGLRDLGIRRRQRSPRLRDPAWG